MGIVGDVAKELIGMFLADARLTMSILVLVAIAAALVDWLHVNPGVSGALLVVGSLLILVEAVTREAKQNEL
jgi:Flp pilus assembly protein TadB